GLGKLWPNGLFGQQRLRRYRFGKQRPTEAIGIDIVVSVICRVITGKEVLNTSPYTLSHVLTHYD
ncbi:hypothetical protein, partial [Aeromonas sp. QDB39]|uniref:hypothetical protein n=1 Tax=Aeromonas sp. QDB39 TaxID=2989828 RepID=UPI0022E46B0A